MAKIMLVEDDNNLREIYEARLAAEGYQIISAPDGEAALALAIKERPDLIISDIMMPKVSGFDMLDILRSTTETKTSKIIMMTALGQAEDKARAEKLGADRYLVKSQVTLEDVVKAAQEVLGEQNPTTMSGVPVEQPAASPEPVTNSSSLTGNAPAVPVAPAPAPQPVTVTPPPVVAVPVTAPVQPAPVAPAPAPVVAQPPAPAVPQSIPVTVAPPAEPAPAPVSEPPKRQALTTPPTPAEETMNNATQSLTNDDKPSGEQLIVKSDATPPPSQTPAEEETVVAGQRKKVISPISDMTKNGPDLQALLAKEGETLGPSTGISSVGNSYVSQETAQPPAPAPATLTPTIAPAPAATEPLPAPVAPAPPVSTATAAPLTVAVEPTEPAQPPTIPDTSTTAEEEAQLQQKIEQFITTQNPTISTSPISDVTPPTPAAAPAPATPTPPPAPAA